MAVVCVSLFLILLFAVNLMPSFHCITVKHMQCAVTVYKYESMHAKPYEPPSHVN